MRDLISVTDDGSIRTDLTCTACDLSKCGSLRSNCMSGVGPKSPDMLFCGYAPGKEDDEIGEPFTGGNGRMLKDMCSQIDLDTDKIRFTNALRCHYYDKSPQKRHWQKCKAHLQKEIKDYRPKAIVAVGGKAFTWLTGFVQIDKFKRVGLPCVLDPAIPVYGINQPVMLYKVDDREKDHLQTAMVSDLFWLKSRAETGDLGKMGSVEGDYKVAGTLEEVKEFIEEFDGVEDICFDFETCNERFEPVVNHIPDDHYISMVSFSAGPGHGRAIPLHAMGVISYLWWDDPEVYRAVHDLVFELLTRPGVRFFGHNGIIFDQKWFRWKFRKGDEPLPRMNITYDTMLANYLIDPDKMGHGLGMLAVRYGKMPPWKPPSLDKLMKNTVELGYYAAKDVDATFRVRQGTESLLTEKQQWLLDNVLLPAGYIFQDLEHRGIPIHAENTKKFGEYIDSQMEKYTKLIRGLDVVKKWEWAQEGEGKHHKAFNPSSTAHVADIMENYLKIPAGKRTEKGAYSTGADFLEKHLDKPFVEYVSFHRKLTKLKSPFHSDLVANCPLARPRINLNGTVTGRVSSSNPNVYNVPREDTAAKAGLDDPRIVKASFGTSEGIRPSRKGRRCILSIDLSQIELRILACLSGDKNLIEAYKSGIDLHRQTAAAAFGVPFEEVTAGQRYQAKAVNFQIPYAASEKTIVEGFIERQRLQFRKEHPGDDWNKSLADKALEDGCRFLLVHKKTYPGVWAYMERCKAQVRQHRYQESKFGRRRYYQTVDRAALRAACNFEIQAAAADIASIGMIRTEKAIEALDLDAFLTIFLYDAVVYDVAIEDVYTLARVGKRLLESVGEELDWFGGIGVPTIADVEIGPTWGELEKVENIEELKDYGKE